MEFNNSLSAAGTVDRYEY